MMRWVTALLWVFAATSSHAGNQKGQTYCVGGYTGQAVFMNPGAVRSTCDKPAIVRMHPKWHFHGYVRKGNTCFSCFDEVDNTCNTIFLAKNPAFKAADVFECRKLGTMDDYGRLITHVIDGVEVKDRGSGDKPNPKPNVGDNSSSKPPKEPKESYTLTPTIEADGLPPGPHPVGATVKVVGTVTDQHGDPRGLSGGTFEVTSDTGQTRTVNGLLRRDGTVVAEVPILSGNSVSIVFTPKLQLGKRETFTRSAASPMTLKVETCAYRARLAEPAGGALVTSGVPVTLRAALFDGDNQQPAQVSAASVRFTVSVGGQTETLSADANLQAVWSPPSFATPTVASIYASGTAGGRAICHGGRAEVTVGDIAVGFDASGLPEVCWSHLPCEGDVKMVLPDGPERATVEQMLAEPGVEVVLYSGIDPVWRGAPRSDHTYRFRATYDHSKAVPWHAELIRADGATIVMPDHHIAVREGLTLDLAPIIDFGEVPAGSTWWSHCEKLDFSTSRSAQLHRWEVTLLGAEACQAAPVLAFTNASGSQDRLSLSPTIQIDAFDPDNPWLDVCLDVPRCAGEVSPDGVRLHVRPLTPEFADREATIGVKWTVVNRNPFACYGWLLGPLLGLLGLFLLVFGIVRPNRFPDGASLRVGANARAVKRSSGVVLTDCPGSGAGFYRDARLGLHGDGTCSGRLRDAILTLKAAPGGLVVISGRLQMQNRRSGQWEEADERTRGHTPISGAIYRVGDLFFSVEV